METWIQESMRARYLRRLTVWAVLLACAIFFATSEHRYIANFVMGPYEFGKAELDSVTDPTTAPRYFVRATGSKAIDTGIEELTIHKRSGVETSRSVSAKYYVLVIGDRLLLVKSSSGTPITAEGELVPISVDLQRQLFNTPGMEAIRARFYPYHIDGASFRVPGYIAIAAALVLGFLLVKYGLPAWRYLQDLSSHPLMKRVSSWGDPNGIALEAKREAASPRYKGGGWLVTEKYLVQSTFFRFDLLRLSDLLWAYKRVTKHRVNFIPTGKTYAAVLACYGGSAEITGKETKVNSVLAFASERAPWAIIGFSDELSSLFSKRTQDFCSAVEQRKRDLARQSPAHPNP